ncbi:uncharacterized mitochondrial protein AtMg00810-like [Aristolochia californica]|uniref:uncharacterized mitochondrial protein AtMg00810-like n=1 Tax=Aristolochia californica TaxID=171875 RepID=UPI0035E0A1BE
MDEEMKALNDNDTWSLVPLPKPVGYTQCYGIDYDETFSPMAKLTSILKPSYGQVFIDALQITQYYLRTQREGIQKIKERICAEFKPKDLGLLKYFLGIEVLQSKHEIVQSQRKYALDLIEETWMMGCKPIDTPMDANTKLCGGTGEDLDIGKYKRLVRRLIYLCVTTPNISYAVSVVSQYMHKPQLSHWQALERILRYLKGASGRGLLYKNHGHFNIEGFLDAGWAGSLDDRKSTSGFYTMVGGNLVTWKSRKQSVVAWSSAEPEYRAMAELLWVRSLLT